MASRWEVERALMWSNIRPMGRLLVLAIATKADVKTGVVADKHTPSLRTLSSMTGLAKSVLPGHLTYLSNLGWLKVDIAPKASRYDRNRYTIMIGNMDPARPSGPPPEPLDESEQVNSGPDDGPLGAGRETDRSDAGETPHDVSIEPSDNGQRSATRTAADQPENLIENASGPSHGPATTTTTSKPKNSRPRVDNDRPDVVEICTYLADSIEQLGFKRPGITKDWRVHGRLLLDEKRKFQPTVESVKNCIDWVAKNKFWWKNIQSMPTLRDKWDRLVADRLDEKRAQAAGPSARGTPATRSAPTAVPLAEQCPEHRGRRASTCGLCKANRPASERRAS